MENKDLGLKIGTKKEAFWTEVKKATEQRVDNAEKALWFEQAVLETVNKKLKEETKG